MLRLRWNIQYCFYWVTNVLLNAIQIANKKASLGGARRFPVTARNCF